MWRLLYWNIFLWQRIAWCRDRKISENSEVDFMSAKRKLSIAVGVAAAIFLGTAVWVRAAVVTFDDLPDLSKRRVTIAPIANGYSGFNWDNFNYISYSSKVAGSGFDRGKVSGQNVAFNRSSQPASVTNTSAFNFTGAYLTAGWKNDLKLRTRHCHVLAGIIRCGDYSILNSVFSIPVDRIF